MVKLAQTLTIGDDNKVGLRILEDGNKAALDILEETDKALNEKTS
jgi:hypothetical protein